jgi:hypothetical protein
METQVWPRGTHMVHRVLLTGTCNWMEVYASDPSLLWHVPGVNAESEADGQLPLALCGCVLMVLCRWDRTENHPRTGE